jgi:hypothetical protein
VSITAPPSPSLRYLPPADRERPDADLAQISLALDWKYIVIGGSDEAALGRIFSWLVGQVQLAGGRVRAPDRAQKGAYRRRQPPPRGAP